MFAPVEPAVVAVPVQLVPPTPALTKPKAPKNPKTAKTPNVGQAVSGRKAGSAVLAPLASAAVSHTEATATNDQSTAEASSPITPPADRLDQIFDGLRQKSAAKQAIFRNTLAAFDCLRIVSQELVVELTRKLTSFDSSVVIEYRPVNDMEFHIRFSGDLLVFIMHSNIVTFPEDFGPMPSAYVAEDFRRRFFGHIMAYNFMADSIKYQRLNDPGYLVGRLLVNIDNHYFLEGVQQLELPENNMSDNLITSNGMRLFVESAMIAAVNNDLIAPPLPEIQRISVKQKLENQQVSRGSKMGFSFSNEQSV